MKGIAKGVLVAVVVLYAAWNLFEWDWYLGVLPLRIGTTYPIHISGESGGREGCGIAVFRLDRATARRIESEGLSFLNTARQSRKSKDAYHRFEEWKPTPDPANLDEDTNMLSYGLTCSDAWGWMINDLYEIAEAPGSFFARGPEKVIVVAPAKRIVVLSWYG